MIAARKRLRFSDADRERYHWLIERFHSAPISEESYRIFDAQISLPPAKTIEESIDLARQPFVMGSAQTACWVSITKKRSRLTVAPCEPVVFEGFEAFRFGVHLEPGNRFRWHVTELSSGSSLTSHCPTRESAIAKASERLSKETAKSLKQKLDHGREHAYARAKRQ